MSPKNTVSAAVEPAAAESASDTQCVDVTLEEGMLIAFTPTGEQLRIASIDGDRITFEMLP